MVMKNVMTIVMMAMRLESEEGGGEDDDHKDDIDEDEVGEVGRR